MAVFFYVYTYNHIGLILPDTCPSSYARMLRMIMCIFFRPNQWVKVTMGSYTRMGLNTRSHFRIWEILKDDLYSIKNGHYPF